MRTVLSFVCASLLFCVSSLASATPQQLLTDLHHMRLAATSMVTNYYMFAGLEADAKFNRLIDSSMERFNSALDSALQQAADNNMDTEVQAVQKDWLKLTELLNTNRNDILTKGFPENHLVDDMGKLGTLLVREISDEYSTLENKSQIHPDVVVERSRELALLMALITEQYAAEGTSNLGYLVVGTGENTTSLSELADQFQSKLNQLQQLVKGQAAEVQVRNISSKWTFVAERIRSNDKTSVPFLVVSYNDRILGHLEDIEANYR